MQSIITDLDDVLANTDHRSHLMDGEYEEEKWEESFRQSEFDPPIQNNIDFVNQAYNEGLRVYIFTSRDEKFRDVTENWLDDQSVSYHELYMRRTGDGRESHEVKEEMLSQIDEESVLYALDDNIDNLRMYALHDIEIIPVGVSLDQVFSDDF